MKRRALWSPAWPKGPGDPLLHDLGGHGRGLPLRGYCGCAKDREIFPGGNVLRKSVFVQWLTALLLFSVFGWWASAGIGKAIAMDKGTNTPAGDPAVVDTVKKIEQDMGIAMVAGDVDKLSQVYGDDFAAVESCGKVITKKTLLTDFKSFHDKLEWFETGPMDVQVFGNIAVVQGSVKEKRSANGKDTSGEFAWMDVFENRAGKWVVTQSAGVRVGPAGSLNTPQDPATVETIKRFEQEVGDAMVVRDLDRLTQAYADDFAIIGTSGKLITKDILLSDFRSGKHNLVAFELGPMNVQVLGNVAVVQASVAEKRFEDGKDISGKFVFMDLLEKRAGKWAIVRTLGARVS
jgi:ketosteroid isomerase-like protein